MAAANYQACMKQMLVYEGGYSNHPADPGGVTLEGVIQTRYNEYRRSKGLPQKALTKAMRYTPSWIAERNEIYRKYYWDVVKGDARPYGVDLALFDYAVNSGPGRALPDFKPYEKLEPVPAIKALCARRLRFVKALRTWSVFGKGWGPRIANVEAIGVKMWLTYAANMNAPGSTRPKKPADENAKAQTKVDVQKELEKEAGKADKTAKQQTGGAVVTGGTAGGAATVEPSLIEFNWATAMFGVFLLAATAFIAYRIYINLERKKAYLNAAASV